MEPVPDPMVVERRSTVLVVLVVDADAARR
jgi:hypothetical protein